MSLSSSFSSLTIVPIYKKALLEWKQSNMYCEKKKQNLCFLLLPLPLLQRLSCILFLRQSCTNTTKVKRKDKPFIRQSMTCSRRNLFWQKAEKQEKIKNLAKRADQSEEDLVARVTHGQSWCAASRLKADLKDFEGR